MRRSPRRGHYLVQNVCVARANDLNQLQNSRINFTRQLGPENPKPNDALSNYLPARALRLWINIENYIEEIYLTAALKSISNAPRYFS